MKTTLVGYTGFVGGNLAKSHPFDNLYNSKNITEAFGAANGLVVYGGMPAEKFLAAADPGADLERAENAFENIQRMKPEKLVLISTVDVYPKPYKVYEDTAPTAQNETPYGKNRLALEGWVREAYPGALILRLPGLYGQGLKKNFIYDMLTLTPGMLVEEKYQALAAGEPLVRDSYQKDDAGFWRLKPLSAAKSTKLRAFFEQNNFNSLSFTDSRSVYQFYNLAGLWKDIGRCLKKGFTLVNLATQPIEAGALYHLLYGQTFENHTAKGPVYYDMRTRHGRELGGLDDYVADRADVVAGIGKLAAGWEKGGGA